MTLDIKEKLLNYYKLKNKIILMNFIKFYQIYQNKILIVFSKDLQ